MLRMNAVLRWSSQACATSGTKGLPPKLPIGRLPPGGATSGPAKPVPRWHWKLAAYRVLKTSRAAAIVSDISAPLCAALTKPAS